MSNNKIGRALYEFQVEAFIEGLSDFEPQPEQYGVSQEFAQQALARVLSALPVAEPELS